MKSQYSLWYYFLKRISSVLSYLGRKLSLACTWIKLSEEAKKRVKHFEGVKKGSQKEYRDTVLTYWRKYGKRPKRFWYTLYCMGSDSYDPRYIPNSWWRCIFLPYFNNLYNRNAYADKGMFNRLLRDVKKPETIVKNIAGYYYNGDGEGVISREEAEKLCRLEDHLIIKPSLQSKGKGISFYDRTVGGEETITNAFDSLKHNFVVQRVVKQHPDLARLNETSLNTIRVISFRFKGQVHILSAQLRIGGKGKKVDNVAAGGFACSVKPDGWLCEKAVNRQSVWVYETEDGTKLKDIKVPNYEEIVRTIKRLHCELPYFNIIGWDFAVDVDGTPVMVEFNVKPAQNQIGDRKPTFGDLSEEVFEDVFIKKTLKNAFR